MIINTLLSIFNKFSPRREEMDVAVDEAPMDAAPVPDQVINAEPNTTVEMITAPPQGQGFNTPVSRPTASESMGSFVRRIPDLIQIEKKKSSYVVL
ncbi:hypothetical protein Aduo_003249 [Ancylostoma duodenale]